MTYSGPSDSESKMKILALLFVAITGCCAKENLEGASFVFYKISQTARVVLKPSEVLEPLSNITFCVQSYAENQVDQRDSLFKLDKNSTSQFHLFQLRDHYNIRIGKEEVLYKASKERMEWKLICMSWESSTGLIHFVVNGKLYPRKILKPGFIIDPDITAVLGHDLSAVGITFFRGEPSYIGEIRNVHMWDRVLHPDEMQSFCRNGCLYCNGNVISWKSVDYEVHGDIFLYKPSKP